MDQPTISAVLKGALDVALKHENAPQFVEELNNIKISIARIGLVEKRAADEAAAKAAQTQSAEDAAPTDN